jgi:hypothetical protein
MNYLILKVNDNRHVLLRPEDSVSLSIHDKISMEEIHTNLYNTSGIYLSVNGNRMGLGELRDLDTLCSLPLNQINIQKGHLLLGSIFFQVNED